MERRTEGARDEMVGQGDELHSTLCESASWEEMSESNGCLGMAGTSLVLLVIGILTGCEK